MSFIVVYVTYKNREEAERISSILLEKRVIACVNFLPIESEYWWKGKREQAHEVVTLLKTRPEYWEKLQAEVKRIHSYETPCIMKIDVEANPEYEAWIRSETE